MEPSGSFSEGLDLLMDLFHDRPAAASGAGDLMRCWFGAIAAATIDYMLIAMGWGWCFTAIGFAMAASLPLICLVYRNGHHWRQGREIERERERGIGGL